MIDGLVVIVVSNVIVSVLGMWGWLLGVVVYSLVVLVDVLVGEVFV